MKKIKAIALALRIAFHWWHIKLYRKRFDKLYDKGEQLSATRVQKLNEQISKHTTAVMRCEKYYDNHYAKSLNGVL